MPGSAAKQPEPFATAPKAGSALSTLNDDGTRRWLHPRVSPGRFLSARRAVAWLLMAVFVALPLIRIDGEPLVLLDIVARRFHLFGATFYPTDTLLLALLLVIVFLSIFWVTALLGRVWCGWACPQTVYMEFVFRPLERLFEGAPGRRKKGWLQTSGAGTVLKHASYLACSFALAHVFLAYFVSWDQLRQWVLDSPFDHLFGFFVVVFVTAAMMFNFGYFREQTCLVACPYGRFQSVLLDRHSLIVRYDQRRGEPRKGPRGAPADLSLPVMSAVAAAPPGDCIDCRMCVTTCPTGIDIRNGLQMECVGCAQCIDACDAVMDKIGKARGLIRYSSQAAMQGQRFRWLRPRVVLYPAVIVVLGLLFGLVLMNTGVADITVTRGVGNPFTAMPDGRIENNLRVKIVNRLDHTADFAVSVEGLAGATLGESVKSVSVTPGQMLTTPVQLFLPREALSAGRAPVTIVIMGPNGFEKRVPFTALGPSGPASAGAVPTTGGLPR